MNLGDLNFKVARKLGLSLNSSDELTLMQKWASEGVIEVLLKTRIRVETDTIALVAGTGDYRLSSTTMQILDASISSGPLVRVTEDEIMQRRRVSVGSAGAMLYASEGDFLRVWPTPTSSGTLDLIVIKKPTPLAVDADDPSNTTYGGIPTWAHRAIEYYMLWQGAEYDDKVTAMAVKEYRAAFEDECKAIIKRRRSMGGRRLTPARIGYPGTQFVTRRNDVYPG